MKIVRMCLIYLIIPLFIYSKNGYKEFEWGMSPADVSATVEDLEERAQFYSSFKAPRYALFYKYEKEIVSSLPNPLSYVSSDIISYDSEKRDLEFYFIDDRLIGVKVTFFNKSIIQIMTDKYGMITPVRGTNLIGNFRTASWFNLPHRIIVWEDFLTGMENVYYMDKAWFTPLEEVTMDEFRRKRQESNSKLD